MVNPAHLTAEKMVGHVQFGSVPLRTAGTALVVAFRRYGNAAPLGFLAMTPAEAREHAADILRQVIRLENVELPQDAVLLPETATGWHPFGTPPDNDRLVLIHNAAWPEQEKTWIGYFDDGLWITSEGHWLDGDPESGAADMPPTHWAEIPQRSNS